MTVEELLRRISSQELSEWMAFYQFEPFGEERDDLRAGIVASTVANANRDPKKGRALKPQDFMPQFDRERKPQTPKEIYQAFRSWAVGAGAGKS
jgi:hypothetical protein